MTLADFPSTFEGKPFPTTIFCLHFLHYIFKINETHDTCIIKNEFFIKLQKIIGTEISFHIQFMKLSLLKTKTQNKYNQEKPSQTKPTIVLHRDICISSQLKNDASTILL